MKQEIRKVKNIEDWIRYFSENLDWNIDFDEIDDIDDISYEYTPEELGLKPESCAKIQSLKQLQPLTNDQPWGIFCIEFEGKRFEITALRRILSSLIPRKRRYVTDRKTWNLNDLLFICSWGEGNETTLGLAHFEEREGVLPQLKVIYCAPAKEDTHNIHTFEERIGHLEWPADPSDTESWRGSWSAAFTSGYRQTIHAAAELTKRLAEEALAIRERILHTLEIETEQGYVHGLYNKFKEQLVHDMKEQDFADMYAQTIVYGLFSARCMDDAPETFSAAEAVGHIPNTNPFLKDLLKECLDVKTRSGISFDELEVGNVVDILAGIDPKEIVQDFGRQTGGGREDPVLHFYEEFLNAYDKTQKVQRGVYYTPQPVVNFIVRAVDDILKNEFGLKDGLASTETKMVEMPVEKAQAGKSGLKTVMEKVEVSAVQVLDPATGTGTFLRQVILTIYENFKAAHKGESDAAIRKAWNEYVPEHLLPRINGFELMMAPYAVAHMKLAMVLQETGYDFHSDKRLQVYLTNTLEEPNNSGSQMSLFTDPLAMESVTANQAKCNSGINVILGNPPYSGESANKGEWIKLLMEDYKKEPGGKTKLDEQNIKWLNDDYVKFIRYAQHITQKSKSAILAYICPHGFLDNPTFRGMRWFLLQQFSTIYLLDLHGNTKKRETNIDGSKDENVFDIQQGVCLLIAIQNDKNTTSKVFHSDLFGKREEKYSFLTETNIYNVQWKEIKVIPDKYLFINQNIGLSDKWNNYFSIEEAFPQNGVGICSKRDPIAYQQTKEDIYKVLNDFATLSEDEIKIKYHVTSESRDQKVIYAKNNILEYGIEDKFIIQCLYRPFDKKWTYYTDKVRGFLAYPVYKTLSHLTYPDNVGLIISRQGQASNLTNWNVVFSTDTICDLNIFRRGGGCVFPLYIYTPEIGKISRRPNISERIINKFSEELSLSYKPERIDNNKDYFSPYDFWCYIYATLFSQKYRETYIEFLNLDFPKIPYIRETDRFWRLVSLGDLLKSIHTTVGCNRNHISETINEGSNVVEKCVYSNNSIYINKNQFFSGISESSWNFQIGGYPVLEKWLKDRKGMILTNDDICHYRQIIATIQRTIEIMEKIDQVIEL